MTAPEVKTTAVNSAKLPITEDELNELVKSQLDSGSNETVSLKPLINSVIEALAKKSSKFKFVVNAHKVSAVEGSASVESSFGARWDATSDGMLTSTVQIGESTWVIFSVVFISSF